MPQFWIFIVVLVFVAIMWFLIECGFDLAGVGV